MSKSLKTYSLMFLMGALLVSTGCASKKQTTKQISALQAQVGVLTDEVTRLDQALQQGHAGAQSPDAAAFAGESFSAGAGSETGSGSGTVYRTPSGFELPSSNIQKALKNAGYYQGSIDGKVGQGTKEALKSFQRDHGLQADGVCGRRTWDKLRSYLGSASASPIK